MEKNNPFFFAINAASTSASTSASAASCFPYHRLQLLESPDLDAPRSDRSARRRRKRKVMSSHGLKEEQEHHDEDQDDDDDHTLSPNKLRHQDSNPESRRTDDRCEKVTPTNPKTAAENGGPETKNDPDEKDSNSRQDYIHVRARRGQATDSHSLAERVRREKISDRMKLLQNLVPGCNKVMGKALMLDEIINYVQSLQRQVEFLSMKLATVNPLDFCVNGHRPKDTNRAQRVPDLPQIHRVENSTAGSSYSQRINGTPLESFATDGTENKLVLDELDPSFCSSISMEFPFPDASQLGNFWEDDLQSVVQMGFFGQSRGARISSQSFCGPATTDSRKIEL